jgi:uncharacterized membrane protein
VPHARRWLAASGVIVVLGLTLWSIPAAAKSFVFSRVGIDATVGPNGSLHIVEARTYRFAGSFSWASYSLPLRGTSGIRSITVADEHGALVLSPSLQPGTYQVSRNGDAVLIRFGFRAADTSRTFTISYVLDDVVAVYDDTAELYWKFIGTGWDRPSEEVRIAVRLPGNLRASQVRAWGHGPLQGDVRPVDGGAVLTVRNLPPSTMVEGRILFPREVVPYARLRRSGAALPRILAEEGVWAAQANRARLVQQALFRLIPALPVLVVGLWVFLYVRYGREPHPTPPQGYYRELPADYSPAELGALWRFGSIQPADFVATILDLVRRGYVTVAVQATSGGLLHLSDETYTLTRTDKTDDLAPHEDKSLEILFGSGSTGGEKVAIHRRKGLPDDAKKRMASKFPAWTRQVSSAAGGRGFFDQTSMAMRWVALVLGFLFAVGGFFAATALAALSAPPTATAGGVGLIAAGLLLAVGSGAIRRRSQRGADDLRRWQGFRRFLLDFSDMRQAELPALTMWEQYLVYAVPIGVADRVVSQLKKIYPADVLARSPGLQPWVSTSSGSHGDPLGSFSGFTTAFAAATSSATSSSGSGGGFSGGGGGGGGGSGGSAG